MNPFFHRFTCLLGLLLAAGTLPVAAQLNWEWATASLGQSTSEGAAITTDARGNVFVAGSYGSYTSYDTHTVQFSPSVTLTNRGFRDLFVAKYDPTGAVAWAASIHAKHDVPLDLANLTIDSTGNVYVGGTCPDSTRFGSLLLTFSNNISSFRKQGFVAKLDPAGRWLWVRAVSCFAGGVAQSSSLTALRTDPAGNVTLVGSVPPAGADSVRVGGAVTTSLSMGVFVARLEATGFGLWVTAPHVVTPWVGAGLMDVQLDAAGDAYLTGYTDTAVVFGADTVRGSSGYHSTPPNQLYPIMYDGFIAKISAAGNWQYARELLRTLPEGLTVQPNGTAMVAASYGNLLTTPSVLGQDTLRGVGALVVPIGPTGQLGRVRLVPNNIQVQLRCWAIGPDGTTYFSSYSRDSLRFGAFTLPALPNGPDRAYVAQLSPAGQWTGLVEALPQANDWAVIRAMAVDPAGRLCVTGGLLGTVTFGATQLTRQPSTFIVARLTTQPLGLPATEAPVERLTLYPNPARTTLTVGRPGAPVQLLDALGRVVRTAPVPTGAETATLDVRGLPAGLYVVRAGRQTRRLVVE